MWFSWGDLGYTAVKTTCGNRYCCNPFHLIPQNVGVFVDDTSYQESFELAVEIHTLKQQVQEFVIQEMLEQEKRQAIIDGDELDGFEAVMLGGGFAERVEAASQAMLKGMHISQTEPTDPGRLREPTDNGDEDESEN